MKILRAGLAALSVMALLPAGSVAAQEGAAPLGGASSIQEVFQDWRVNCVVQQNAKQCAMSQQQNQKDSNQLLIAAEIAPAKEEGTAAGVILLPFGLLLSSGITLQIDDKPAMKPAQFRTCMPGGCVVPISLDKATMTTARSATALKVTAVMSATNQPVALSISLKGFAQAYDRLKTVSGQ